MEPLVFETEFVFPAAPADYTVKALQDYVFDVCALTTAIKDEILSFLRNKLKSRGKMSHSCAFWMEMALEEVLLNIPKHDMLDILGTEWEIFKDEDWGNKKDEFTNKILTAQGLTTTIRVEIHDRGFAFSYTLSREFDTFPDKWMNARLNEPDEADLRKACGRGLILMGKCFDEGFIKTSDKHRYGILCFDKVWKHDDFVQSSEAASV